MECAGKIDSKIERQFVVRVPSTSVTKTFKGKAIKAATSELVQNLCSSKKTLPLSNPAALTARIRFLLKF